MNFEVSLGLKLKKRSTKGSESVWTSLLIQRISAWSPTQNSDTLLLRGHVKAARFPAPTYDPLLLCGDVEGAMAAAEGLLNVRRGRFSPYHLPFKVIRPRFGVGGHAGITSMGRSVRGSGRAPYVQASTHSSFISAQPSKSARTYGKRAARWKRAHTHLHFLEVDAEAHRVSRAERVPEPLADGYPPRQDPSRSLQTVRRDLPKTRQTQNTKRKNKSRWHLVGMKGSFHLSRRAAHLPASDGSRSRLWTTTPDNSQARAHVAICNRRISLKI